MLRRKDRGRVSYGSLPGYADLEEIGGGAFASVYRATEEETGRRVALKILKLETVQTSLLETFQREIQALGQVSDHPNIVTLYRPLTTPDGRPVLVLELCRESVATQVRTSGPMDARTATTVGIKMCGALETAHRNGFLHRDLKPQNILITQFGEPALADFGVAALQSSAQASAGVFGFTTVHAAPEMLEGQPLSPASDVYGLASSIYQMLTGQPPFAAFENEAPASVILRILRDPARLLLSQDIPLDLSDVIAASLAKRPEDRPPTALELARQLQAVEESAGWPETQYVVWGERRLGPASSVPPRPRPSPVPDMAAPTLAAAIDGSSAVSSAPPAPPPAVSAPPPPPVSAPPPVPAPPAPPVRRGPSIEVPEIAVRNVVTPAESERGQPSPPLQTPSVAFTPLGPLDSDSSSLRPQFVDPGSVPPSALDEGESSVARSRSESVYESTMQIGQLFRPGAEPDPEPARGPSGRLAGLPVAVWAGVGVGLVVVLAAVLLIVGVI